MGAPAGRIAGLTPPAKAMCAAVSASRTPAVLIVPNDAEVERMTVDARFSIAQAIAISGGRFTAIGSDAAIRKLAGPSTTTIDLHGQTVIPAGATIEGRVTKVNEPRRFSGKPTIGIMPEAVIMPTGERYFLDATLTDTNEIQYGFTQLLFLKEGDGQPLELVSWSIFQKHFFDPTFGGAALPGVRNVFQALNSITPFAFATGPVHWSPIVSDFKITPGGRYDTEQILEYDPHLDKITTIDDAEAKALLAKKRG